MQVLNLHLLVTLFGPTLHALVLTCDDLHCTLVEIKSAPKSMQICYRLATQPKSTQVKYHPIHLLLANEIQDISGLKWVLLQLARRP